MDNRWAQALQGAGAWLSGQGPRYEAQRSAANEAAKRTQLLQEEQARRDRMMANVEDTARMASLYQMGDLDGVSNVLQGRIQALQQSGGDPSHSIALLQMHQQDPNAAARDVMAGYQTFQSLGYLKPMGGGPEHIGTKDGQAIFRDGDRVYAKPVEGYTQPNADERTRLENEKIRAEIEKIKRESQGLSKDEREVVLAEKKEILKKNVERISELSKGVEKRRAVIAKAGNFLQAFESGGMSSGAGREFLGEWVSGTWTKQGQFDEEFDSFAEVAAREKLKAVGEVRPTDADVEGMKRSLFGKGRDETTNINLLRQFIEEQQALDTELNALRDARDSGGLSDFSWAGSEPEKPATPPADRAGWQLMVDANGNRAYVGPNGEIEEVQ